MQEQQEMQVGPLGGKDPIQEETAIHSNILAWKTPTTEEPSRLQSMGLQRVRHDQVTEHGTAIGNNHYYYFKYFWYSLTSSFYINTMKGMWGFLVKESMTDSLISHNKLILT